MKRDLNRLASKTYDFLIVGAGIYGAAIAWDAALRGFSVALVDKEDFGGETSANSLRIIHGGLRYLQQMDFTRMRESIRERRALIRIAPHLVHPLMCAMPTYGLLHRGRGMMALALVMNDLIGFDRNGGLDPSKHLPSGRTISREACLHTLPGVRKKGLTGAAVWYDAQMHNSERLTLAFILSAHEKGADIANYVRATGFLREGKRVLGVTAEDVLTGQNYSIRCRTVINAGGPWADRVLNLLKNPAVPRPMPLSKAWNLLLDRPVTRQAAAAVSRPGGQIFFLVPWRGLTLMGTVHSPFQGDPEHVAVSEAEIRSFLHEVNEAYPGARIRRQEVVGCYVGLLPGKEVPAGSGRIQLFKRPFIRDHRLDDLQGIISVVGIKFTTARGAAEKVIDKAARLLGKRSGSARTEQTPLVGGDIKRFGHYLASQMNSQWKGLAPETLKRLVLTYGSAYRETLLKYEFEEEAFSPVAEHAEVTRAEVLHAVREEMAQKLTDVVLRRTDLGWAGFPGEKAVETCAQLMARDLGWDDFRTQQEIEECRTEFLRRQVRPMERNPLPSVSNSLTGLPEISVPH
jgi:glycerol-3-phosphate dehydrogenase